MPATGPVVNADLHDLANFTDKQQAAYDLTRTKTFILYGGAAGGGKSRWLRWSLLLLLFRFWMKYKIPNVLVGLFCEDYPTLKDRQISKIPREFPQGMGRLSDFMDIGLAYRLDAAYGGGAIQLRNLDDPNKYDSAEFAAIGVDELTKTTIETFDELRKRRRWPGFPDGTIFPFLGATNPGGIGHAYVKDYWIDHKFPPYMDAIKDKFDFVQAKASDNPHLPKTYYSEELLTLPPDLRRAYAEGDWDMFKGQFFRTWRRDIHVVLPFKIPAYWRRFVSSDWGYAKPWCILWWAVSPEGFLFIYREMYLTEHLPKQMMEKFKLLSAGEHHYRRMMDPGAWDDSRGLSIADQCAQNGVQWEKATNARADGWTRLREYLFWQKDADERLVSTPHLQVFSTCENLIRTMPAQVYDKTDVEDLDSDGEDHAPDAARYGVMTQPGLSVVPLDLLDDEYAEAVLRAAHRGKQKQIDSHDLG